ncbi:MAG TPA: hypothetical protein VFS17_08070 [Methylophilaceae bacterium]|nr:hypothetical protein [Methylophilaceae bacterium]
MKRKLLKISIAYDKASDESVCIRITDNETGYQEEIRGTLENIKNRVHGTLQSWHRDGRAALSPEVCEYYAAYADYETRRKAAGISIDD